MPSRKITWLPLSKKTVFSTRVFTIQEINSKSPAETNHIFYALDARDWVIVVPVLSSKNGEDSFLLVTQWRHGNASESIEFPGGVIDDGELPKEAAGRELLEETGYKAKSLTLLASLSPNPAIMTNCCHVFLAEELENTFACAPDDDEYITTSSIPVHNVIQNMGHGKYSHGLMLSALFLYLQKKGVSV